MNCGAANNYIKEVKTMATTIIVVKLLKSLNV